MTLKKLWITLGSLLGLVIITAGAYVGYFALGGRALPGTKIGDVSVAGMTAQEIQNALDTTAQSSKITVSGAAVKETEATLADLGYQIDTEATASAALARNDEWLNYVRAPFTSASIEPKLTCDEAKLATFTNQLTATSAQAAPPVEPRATLKDGKFVATPGKAGTGVDPEALRVAAAKLAATQTSVTAELSTAEVKPSISDEQMAQTVKAANNSLQRTVAIVADGDTYTADDETKAAWVKVKNLDVSVDGAAVKAWVDEQVQAIEKDGVTGVRGVGPNGELVRVVSPAVAEVRVTNADEVQKQIVAKLAAQSDVTVTVKTAVGEEKWEDRRVAVPSQAGKKLAYQALEGEKWIDVNLSTFKMTAYEGATVVRGPITVVGGAAQTPTVTGTYKIYHKTTLQDMRGLNVDGTRYLTKDVPWNMFFTGGYAIHGAPWRGTWGFGASHGCVNTPVPEAKWLFQWAPIGTTVVSHY